MNALTHSQGVSPGRKRHLARRIFKVLAVLAVIGMLAIAALFATLRIEHSKATTLPTPTGSFPVGRAVYDWVDSKALDALAPVAGTKRELLVWIWYPAAPGPSAEAVEYVPSSVRSDVALVSGKLLSQFLTRDLAKVHANSLRDADVSPQQPSYPVVILRAGASSEVWNYSTLAEDLASHGYIVVGFDAPYRTSVVVFPDGRAMHRRPENNPELCEEQESAQKAACVSRIMTAWTSDIAFLLDRLAQWNASETSSVSDASGRFKGRLDLTRVGVFGHSFGGATAAQFCHDDSRCKAAIDVDGQPFGSVIQEGLHQPFMFLMGDHRGEIEPESVQIMANIRSIYDRLPPDARLLVMIRGANHFLFSDDGALLKSHVVMRVLHALGVVGIDGRRQLAVTVHCVHSFFDAYLKAAGASRPEIPSPLYPELQVQK